MATFLESLHSGRVLLMDGAMGTELQRAGMPEEECYELWNLTHPEKVHAIHRAYVVAGAQCVLTHTFQSNPQALARHGQEAALEQINSAALDIARSAAPSPLFVLADIGPMQVDESAFRRTLHSLSRADAFLLETWSDLPPHLRGSVAQQDWNPHGVPVLFSITCRLHPQTGEPLGDVALPAVADWAHACGMAALGVNCGKEIGMDEILELVRRLRQVTDLPLFARPNAGTPWRAGERWLYPRTPEDMAARLPELLDASVRMIGGCCGTTPETIRAFRKIVDLWNARQNVEGKPGD
jgi:5-methyltetrahydrofolate--homocysteine methyltransferase